MAIGAILFVAFSIRPQSTLVDAVTVGMGTFQKTVVDEGVTAFKVKRVITAPADGITPTLSLKAGDKVKKGQVLAVFEWDRDFKMKSPIDGYVLRIFEKDRRHVPRGTPILEVGSPESLEIVAELLSEEVVDVRVGMKASITQWGKDFPLEATVRKVERSAQEKVSALGVREQRVKVYLDIVTKRSRWEGLGDGYRVEVSIVTSELSDVPKIPIGTLISDQGKPAVFLIESQRIVLQTLEIADRNQNFVVPKGDFFKGKSLVLYPGSGLSEGDRVKIR